MKIGILTFHWATNYGALLQCYALQTYLENQGHTVEVIDYKPRQYDDSLYAFFRFRKFMHLKTYIENITKENSINEFRKEKLKLSKRFYSYLEIPEALTNFDAIISGSDQVLNPFFLIHGEGRNILTPTYFLEIPFEGKKIGYALSFGCVSYPPLELNIAVNYINNFDSISVRENTGVNIVSSMGRKDAVIVPDPTLLMFPMFYHILADDSSLTIKKSYVYSYFIRHTSARKPLIDKIFSDKNVLWNNSDGDYTMQGWLYKIKHADFVITDSFHCMVMCLKFHKPFAIITEQYGNVGMNDRFYSLLEKMSLVTVIKHKTEICNLHDFTEVIFEWEKVDKILEEYMTAGEQFLNGALG